MKLKKLFYLTLFTACLSTSSYTAVTPVIITNTGQTTPNVQNITGYFSSPNNPGTWSFTTKAPAFNVDLFRRYNDTGQGTVLLTNGTAAFRWQVVTPVSGVTSGTTVRVNAQAKLTPYVRKGTASVTGCNPGLTTATLNAFCPTWKNAGFSSTPAGSGWDPAGSVFPYTPDLRTLLIPDNNNMGFWNAAGYYAEEYAQMNITYYITPSLADGTYTAYVYMGGNDDADPFTGLTGFGINGSNLDNTKWPVYSGKAVVTSGTINVKTYAEVTSQCVHKGTVDTTRPNNSGTDVLGHTKDDYCTGGKITFGSTAGSPLKLTEGTDDTLYFEDVLTVIGVAGSTISLNIYDYSATSNTFSNPTTANATDEVRTAWLDSGLFMTYKITQQPATIAAANIPSTGIITYTLPLNTRPNTPWNGLRVGKFRVTITTN